MRSKAIIGYVVILFGISSGVPAKGGEGDAGIPLTDAGKELEARYEELRDSLKLEIQASLPSLDENRKAAFLKSCRAELAAKRALEEARKQLDEHKKAKALVGHAKGKWIGGADRGIAAAKKRFSEASSDEERKAAEQELIKWRKNREDGVQALEERQAALEKAEAALPANRKAHEEAGEALAEAKSATLNAVGNLGLDAFLSDGGMDPKLARYAVLLEATPRRLAGFAQQGDARRELIDKLLSADDLLVEMAVADGAAGGEYGRAMEIYRDIWMASDKVAEGPLRRLALAISLEHAVPVRQRNAVARTDAPTTVDPVGRYLHYEKALIDGELDPAFKDLSVWEYRMVVNGEEPDEILGWGREMLRNYRPDHITTSDYRWRYVAAVRSDIRYGSQDNKHDKDELQFFQNILMNGGICGRRAFFGRFILRAFGIPTTARPSRGHAALAHWTPDGWVVCLGGGWGAGWTKTRYDRDLDFLATTQARALGEPFMRVKRAQWIGDVMDEERVFGLEGGKNPGFWHGVSLYGQKKVIREAKAKTLAAVGEDIGEANETKEKVEIVEVALSDRDRTISIDGEGVIKIPAVATSKPTRSTGKIIFMDSHPGGRQLHYSRTGGHQDFEYAIEVPTAGRYELVARVVTPSWRQSLLLTVNDAGQPVEIALPHTVGMWGETQPVSIELAKGRNLLRFSRAGEVKGVTIKDFRLRPVSER